MKTKSHVLLIRNSEFLRVLKAFEALLTTLISQEFAVLPVGGSSPEMVEKHSRQRSLACLPPKWESPTRETNGRRALRSVTSSRQPRYLDLVRKDAEYLRWAREEKRAGHPALRHFQLYLRRAVPDARPPVPKLELVPRFQRSHFGEVPLTLENIPFVERLKKIAPNMPRDILSSKCCTLRLK